MPSKKKFLDLELSQSPLVNYGVLIGTLVLIVSIALAGYFAYSNYMTFAPTHIAVDSENHVVINIEDKLYRINPNGQIVSSIDYQTMKVEKIADIGFVDDGLIVVDTKALFYKCSMDLDSCTKISSTYIYQKDEVMIDLITFDNFFYFIHRYRFEKFDMNGKFVDKVKLVNRDFIPIRGVAESNTTLMLFNKDNRVVTVQDTRDYQPLNIQKNYQIDIDKHILNIALDKNRNLWFITKHNIYFIDNKNLLPFTKNIQTVAGDAIEPVNIVAFKEGVLILDHKSMQLLYTQKSQVLQPFGSREIQNLLKQLKMKKEQYNLYEMIFQVISFVAIAFMALLLWLESKRSPLFPDSLKFRKDRLYTLPKEKEIEPDSRGIIWIRPPKEFVKNQKLVYKVAMILAIFIVGGITYMMEVSPFVILGIMGITALILIQSFNQYSYFLYDAIGVDDTYFYYFSNKIETKSKIEKCYYTNSLLYLNSHISIWLDSKERGYDKDQLGIYLYPKLNRATYYTTWELSKKRLREKDKETIQTIILVILAFVLLFFLEYWKDRDFL